jgi:hypothetical protein
MNLILRLLALVAPAVVVSLLISAGMRAYLSRQRGRIAALTSKTEAEPRFETTLNAARVAKPSTFAPDGRAWFSLRAPVQLMVGADAFIVSAPKAFQVYAFRGCECSISLSQAPSSPFAQRDWIVIMGLCKGPVGSSRQARLAIAHDNIWEIWRALAATGAEQR